MFKFLIVALAFVATTAQASDTTTCGKVEGEKPYGYCITTTPGSKSQDVLYVLHGAGGDGKGDWWSTDPALDEIKATWKNLKYEAPRVIEVSFGAVWLLTPKTSNPRSGLLEFFVDSVMPTMEGKLSSPVQARRLLGHSMGGLNSATLVMRHPKLFRSAALLAPAFLGISPFADKATQTQYETSRGMPVDYAKNVMSIARAYVGSEDLWAQYSPTIAGRMLLNAKSPALLVSAGTKDLLFYEEARIFAEIAEQAGTKTIWDKHEEGHGYVNSPLIARFLTL